MLKAVLDTHAVIWYLYADQRLSNLARQTIEQIGNSGDTVAVSSITLAEIVYLGEKGRISAQTIERLLIELDRENSILIEIPLARNIVVTMGGIERSDVPDLPDRIIAATALYLNVP
ncbi:MAG: PIN domain protein [Microcystis aeruginosa CACIAM 03]|nr:MAG: PIN domain protein [Microcystis aeruginosa CACIAM 03]